jgi:hypothetical protein
MANLIGFYCNQPEGSDSYEFGVTFKLENPSDAPSLLAKIIEAAGIIQGAPAPVVSIATATERKPRAKKEEAAPVAAPVATPEPAKPASAPSAKDDDFDLDAPAPAPAAAPAVPAAIANAEKLRSAAEQVRDMLKAQRGDGPVYVDEVVDYIRKNKAVINCAKSSEDAALAERIANGAEMLKLVKR